MSTNFLPFNIGLANAESDATYSTDPLRTGGAVTDGVLPSPFTNKAWYQWSIFVAAMAQSLANKGYVVSDADFSNLVAVLSNIRTLADVSGGIQTVTYSSSVLFNAASYNSFDLTLTGNVASSNITGQAAGQTLLFIIAQDGTGGRTFAWPSSLTNPGAICSLANSITIQMFIVRPSGAIVPITQALWISGSGLIVQLPAVVSISSSGNVAGTAQEIVELVDSSGGAITRTLFSAVGRAGFKVNIKKTDASQNAVTIAGYSGQTIDRQASIADSTQGASYQMVTDGANWWII
jgi:hypothetical protein